jgi:hypothetical protein
MMGFEAMQLRRLSADAPGGARVAVGQNDRAEPPATQPRLDRGGGAGRLERLVISS